jgi:membrane protein implicated in regulation of membrane protease activity
MTMEPYLMWLVAGIGLIIIEVMVGTLLLLMLGLAAFGGAAAAWLGYAFPIQALVAVALAAIGMLLASTLKKKKAAGGKDESSLDVGQMVTLESWVSEADGVAKVRYRNATWDAHVSGERTPGGSVFFIVSTSGNTLNISSKKP